MEGVKLPETAIDLERPAFHPPGFSFDAQAAGVRVTMRGASA